MSPSVLRSTTMQRTSPISQGEVNCRSFDPAAGRLALAASSVQQHFVCRQQLATTQRHDDGIVRFGKNAKRIRIAVSAQRLPVVHSQEGAFKQRSDDLIALPVALPQHECEGCVPSIFTEFQKFLAHLILSRSMCSTKSTQHRRE